MVHMTPVEMANIILDHNGPRPLPPSKLLGGMRTMFGLRSWDVVDECLEGCSQEQRLVAVLERDRDQACFTRDSFGHYCFDADKRAILMFGSE